MSESKFTSGPYEIREEANGASVKSISAMGVSVAWFGTNGTFRGDSHYTISLEEAMANASLFCTAEELLRCLISIREDCSRGAEKLGMSADGVRAIIARCDEYIAKAGGETS
jgi:hypothetical protein